MPLPQSGSPARTKRCAAAAFLIGLALLASACGAEETAVEDTFRVRFETTKGDFIVEAHKDWAPNGVERFLELLDVHYFDEGRFFRVVPGFIAQFGVHRQYWVHAEWRQYFILDDPRTQSNTRGTLSFAQSEKHSRTTEIFINLADNSALLDEQGFTPFARVVEGMEVVDSFYAGYGEMMPEGDFIDPGRVEEGANAYLEERFPELDYILSTQILQN